MPTRITRAVEIVQSRSELIRLQWKPSLMTYVKCSSVGVKKNTVGRTNIKSAGLTAMDAIQSTGNKAKAP